MSYLHDPDNHLDIKLQVDIEVGIQDLDEIETQKLMERANKTCPYSRAIENGHIDVTLKAVLYQE